MSPLSKSRQGRRRASGAPRRSRRQELGLGLAAASTDKLLYLVRHGLPFTMFTTLSGQIGMPITELASILDIPPRTLARRRVAGKLGQDESERLLRIAAVIGRAVQLFEGDVAGAVTWLKSPQKALSHHTPLSYARFEIGAREVESLIGRLEHGVFS